MGSDIQREVGRNAQVVRILTILHDLSVLGGVDLYELASRYGTTTRTVRRDLDALREAGLPLVPEAAPDDSKRQRWRLDSKRHSDQLKSLLNASHYLSLRMALAQGGMLRKADGFFATLEDLADRIARALGDKGRAQLDAIENAVHSHEKFLYTKAPADVFIPLIKAITEKRLCQVSYRAPRAAGKAKQYEVLPLKIFAHDSAPYLLAHVAKHDQVIVLNLQRLDALKLTTRTGTPPKHFRAEDWESQAFGLFTGTPPVKYRLVFNAEAAPYIRERQWHASQALKDRKDGSVEITFTCPESYEVTAWVASWRDKVAVLEPATLRAELGRVGAWLAATYTAPTAARRRSGPRSK